MIHRRRETRPLQRMVNRTAGDRRGQSDARARKQGGYGWAYVHAAIDDLRLSSARLMPTKKLSAPRPSEGRRRLRRRRPCRACDDRHGACYKSLAFRETCRELGLRHIRTKPYTPRTNGKAERFIQTALRERAYARAYKTSDERAADLPIWLHMYNWHRPHGSLNSKPPISRLGLNEDNLLKLHI